VVDLARGHVKAVQALNENLKGVNAISLGTDNGLSVLQIVRPMESKTKTPIACNMVDRKAGGIAACYANASKARQLLDLQTKFDLIKW